MYDYKTKILEVHDGDTFKALVDLGFDVKTNVTFRMSGINAPELKGETLTAGLASRDALRALILGKEVVLKSKRLDTAMKREKFGRYLAEVFIEDPKDPKTMLNVNQYMIANGYAVAFMI